MNIFPVIQKNKNWHTQISWKSPISFNFLNLIQFEFFVAAEIKRQMWQSDDQKRINLNYEVGILNSRWHFGIFFFIITTCYIIWFDSGRFPEFEFQSFSSSEILDWVPWKEQSWFSRAWRFNSWSRLYHWIQKMALDWWDFWFKSTRK